MLFPIAVVQPPSYVAVVSKYKHYFLDLVSKNKINVSQLITVAHLCFVFFIRWNEDVNRALGISTHFIKYEMYIYKHKYLA